MANMEIELFASIARSKFIFDDSIMTVFVWIEK